MSDRSPRPSAAVNALADGAGVALIAAFMLVAAVLTPAETLSLGMFIFFFAIFAVISIYTWHKPQGVPETVREWMNFLGAILLSTAVILGVGVGYAYFKGVRGDVMDMIASNGTFLVLMYFCPALALLAAGGLVRAVVLRLTGREPD
jgi:hypothetical protein